MNLFRVDILKLNNSRMICQKCFLSSYTLNQNLYHDVEILFFIFKVL